MIFKTNTKVANPLLSHSAKGYFKASALSIQIQDHKQNRSPNNFILNKRTKYNRINKKGLPILSPLLRLNKTGSLLVVNYFPFNSVSFLPQIQNSLFKVRRTNSVCL